MKKALLILAMFALALCLLTGCQTPDDVEPEETPEVTAPPPTYVAPTPDPTTTPIPMTGVEWPEDPSATLLTIDPVDMPTRAALTIGDFIECLEAEQLGIVFRLPAYWTVQYNAEGKMIYAEEPVGDIRSGSAAPASVSVQRIDQNTAQNETTASAALDSFVASLRTQYGDNIEVTATATNPIMSEVSPYLTFWVDYKVDPEDNTQDVRMRGRCTFVPKGTKLYAIWYMCPAEFNADYVEVYYEVRRSIKEL